MAKEKANTSKTNTRKTQTKRTAKVSSQYKRLKKELDKLIEQMDEEGLIYLLKQAQVLVHNQQVDKINREISELEEKKRNKKTTKTSRSQNKTRSTEAAVSIEDNGRKNFILTFNGARKFLDLEEMRSLVRISHSAEGTGDGISRLYKWITRNRQDILIDSGVAKASHPALELLYKFIISHYTTKN